MSMMRNLIRVCETSSKIDLAFTTGREIRGIVTQVRESADDLSDCATILFTPALAETPFCIAVPHIMHIRVVSDENQRYTQAPGNIQGRL